MREPQWVYPNTSELNRGGNRGGLAERDVFRASLGFGMVEVPGDFVKNGSECERLGVELGYMLTSPAQAALIYGPTHTGGHVRYSLHTEPSIPRSGRGYRPTQADLRWYDAEWLDKFWVHIASIVDHIGVLPEIVEVHPGYRPNTPRSIALAVSSLLSKWRQRYGGAPLFLLENRTGQVVARGRQMAEYWTEATGLPGGLSSSMGLVLDVQQLFTEAKSAFTNDLMELPLSAIRECHVHAKHSTPSHADPIDWDSALRILVQSRHAVYVLPEVHHNAAVSRTVEFVAGVLERLRA